ncbi:hypothetical protein AAVH_41198 [Aphelenchoides avenae]|nr:hypothetical protein AAVH_41198 [Aphelenchus avenae]
MVYYAVAVGRQVGVFETVNECNKHVTGFSGSIAKKFKKRSDALKFVEENKKAEGAQAIATASAPTGGPKNSNYEPLAGTRRMPTTDAAQDRFRTPPLSASTKPSKHAVSSLPTSVNVKEGTKRQANDQPKNSNYAPLGSMRKIPKLCDEDPKMHAATANNPTSRGSCEPLRINR